MPSGEAAESTGQNSDWSKFFSRLSRVQGFKDLVQGTNKETKRLEEASRQTWNLCRDDRARLQRRLDELNLNTLKQVSALKAQLSMYTGQAGKSSVTFTEHSIEFYEPLQYLSDTARELVLKIVEDKLQNSHSGPPREDGGEWQQRCEEAEDRAQKAEEREVQLRATTTKLKQELDAAEEKAEELGAQLRGAMAQVQQLQMDKARLEEEKAHLEERVAELQERNEELEHENARLKAERARMEAELAASRQRLEAMENELNAAKEQLEKVQHELERLQARVQELEEQVRSLEARLKEAQAEVEGLKACCAELEARTQAAERRAEAAEAEAAELRAELARRNNTQTKGEQTNLLGVHIQELMNENERLKSMVDGAVVKLEESGFGHMAEDLHTETEIVKVKSCFHRLYQDAMERGERLQRLREKYAEQKKPEVETQFTTWDQELEEAIQVQQAIRAEEARFREYRKLHNPAPPLPVDVGPLPPMWGASPRRRTSVDSNCTDSWRVVQPERKATFHLQSMTLSGSSPMGSFGELSSCLGAHTSLVLQPPTPRLNGLRSSREGALRSSRGLPPLHA